MNTGPDTGSALPGSRTVAAYYEGAYGPTLRIDIQTLEDLADIKMMISRLASGEASRVSMGDLRVIAMEPPVGGITLTTVTTSGTIGQRKKVRQVATADGKLTFDWQQTACEWEDTEGLLDGLLDAGRRGVSAHQYLTNESTGDVLIEFALNEGRLAHRGWPRH